MWRELGGLALVVACALVPACSSKRGESHLVPSEATARQALEVALDAWKGGQAKPGPLSLGLDPLWVIRHEDFEMLAHWDHPVKKP